MIESSSLSVSTKTITMLTLVFKVIGILYFMANGYIAGSFDVYCKDEPNRSKYLNLIINLLLGVPRFLMSVIALLVAIDLKNTNSYD